MTGCRLSDRGCGCAVSKTGEVLVGVKSFLLSDIDAAGGAGRAGVGVSGVRGPLLDPVEGPSFEAETVTDP